MKLQIGKKQIIVISLLACCLVAAVFIVRGIKSQPESNPYEMIERFENVFCRGKM